MSSSEQEPNNKPDATEPTPAGAAASGRRRTVAILLFLALWTYLYNLALKGEGPVRAFFRILDTLSDDFVMGSLLTVAIGLIIIVVFSLTKLYGQILANVASFRILEEMVFTDLRHGHFRAFFVKMLNFRDLPRPEQNCPRRVGFVLLSFCAIYVMSWVYVTLFSEALFFASWSAGVNLPINEHNVVMMPTLALAIPFSARVMAYFRYAYAQDFADLMPAATFVLLLVTTLGYLFESPDQQFYLKRVFADANLFTPVLTNAVFLGFIPVFSEALFWLVELNVSGKPSVPASPDPATDNAAGKLESEALKD